MSRVVWIVVALTGCYDFGHLRAGSPDAAADGEVLDAPDSGGGCGMASQACCQQGVCGIGLACEADGSICRPCGAPGELCCVGSACDTSLALCTGAVCVAKNVWAVGTNGSQGVAAQWNGSQWSTATQIAGAYHLDSISGGGAVDIWAVGSQLPTPNPQVGLAAYRNGIGWTGNTLSGTTALSGVWEIDASDAWAAGYAGGGGTIAHWTGSWATSIVNGTSALAAVWAASPSDVWAVGTASGGGGGQGAAAHWNGANLGSASVLGIPGTSSLLGVWGSGAGDVWAVGSNGSQGVLVYWGSGWSSAPMVVPIAGTVALRAVWGSGATDVWAVGQNASQGVVVHWRANPPAAPSITPINNTLLLRGIWGSGPKDIWAVGANGSGSLAVHWTGSWSSAMPISGASDLWGVWGVAR